ncbi:RNA polymerase sigma factor, sigma-70 family [Thermodesulfatator indicus DSM 15286]|uniref:RNA polymerase sigma factor, sigma-70 family n=1 Tax=Thermodesulfatator indicus (strain DSM 15286 / JCM 11887 / CIR29812) TaxID=667014 RepID=F8ADL7_THEID|nr:sigma-70 family RNA polymerase sigma factor [Thermodesulfatator indicus]AEH44897.1 RNA polymerase sigma factor, sigma-70 family [Thermodesulfatator indicus DSM 15286]
MQHHVIYRDISPADKKLAENYVAKIIERFEKLTNKFDPDLVHLRIVVEGLEKKKFYFVQLTLSVPQGVLSARGEHKRLKTAFKIARERLEKELARHLSELRGEHVYKRHQRYIQEMAKALPELAVDKQADLKERFMDRLRPLLRDLYRIARREILFHQLTGELPPEYLDPGDVVDEAILWAYENYDQIVAMGDLAHALHKKILEIIKREINKLKEEGHEAIPVEETVPLDDVRYKLKEMPESPYFFEEERLRWEDVLPAGEVTEPEEALSAEELNNLIMRELSRVPEEKRQAFVWHVLDGLSFAEIAKLQGRDEESVRQDIEEVREYIRQRWQALGAKPKEIEEEVEAK